MKIHHAASLVAVASLGFAGCATLGGGSTSTAAFAGKDALKARTAELTAKASIASACSSKEPDKGGIIEITGDAAGKLTARVALWRGDPAIGKCIADKAALETVTPLAGPPVSTLWMFTPKDAPPPAQPDKSKVDEGTMQASRNKADVGVQACAQRNLPPEFGSTIHISFYVFPGGKPFAANVTDSNAKDGAYESCALEAVLAGDYPDYQFDGPVPVTLSFKTGNGGPIE